ncbi:FAD-dependent oxidoreductase [Variovorax sp. HJSM1_2]|uniref:FAD-dependent oxidoreductase n=1 Tax=Variovorax sp. HJSM1_2 TaxID=3366263 RepID=UPI003BD363C2
MQLPVLRRRGFLASASAATAGLAGCQRTPDIEGGFIGQSVLRGHALRDALRNPAAAAPAAGATQQHTRVLILGAGVAGLAAARALRLRGMEDFAVLDLEDRPGGNSRGGQVAGIACPLGAHYLPVPGPAAAEVQNLLEELGLRQRVAGRWVYDERHLCHSPQERLFFQGAWQEGLLPLQGVGAGTLAQYEKFAALVAAAVHTAAFAMPMENRPLTPEQQAQDAITFEAWLDQHQLTDEHLRWYLGYCCRDDYGAGITSVSAWAGLHYFASRHGFRAPSAGEAPGDVDSSGVLTWPEGNGWLGQRLAAPLGARLHSGQVVTRIAAEKHHVEVDVLDVAAQRMQRWQADRCIVALPLFVAARVLQNPPPALVEAASQLRYAPWLVANLHIGAALDDRPGAAPSWDNVLYHGQSEAQPQSQNLESLGYVDAMHQSLRSTPGPTVLTCYRALGLDPNRRRALLEQPWTSWRDSILAELAVPHPDLAAKATRLDIMRYGHAMATPVPGLRSSAALAALRAPLAAPWQRLRFAHSDLAAYSVFEEAFTSGHRAGSAV